MQVEGAVALVTGAGRGLGRVFARELVRRGAATVYGAARDPGAVTEPGVSPVALDITDPVRVAQAARQCADVSLLVNNAGVMTHSPLIGATSIDGARLEMETNYFGTLAMCRAFTPVLAANGGGALVNVLSVVSWLTNPVIGSYGASKAAEWALTNDIRIELARTAPWSWQSTPVSSTPTWQPGSTRPRSAPRQSPGRCLTPSRPARSRCSPTSGPGRSRRHCHAIMS
jgi:NAD(P)-dependent dehydrogenase (short-subunit alcohol dehydrogenase family)